jgi:uncharacterized protein involved in exopolysaccharide biosynthesis
MLWRRKWLVALCVFLGGAVFATAAFLMTPIYRATVVVVPADSNSTGLGVLGSALAQFGGLASLAGIDLGGSSAATEESLAVLRSREFTERFIRDRNLMPLLFHKKWDAANNRWKGDPKDAPTLAQGYKYFDKRIRRISEDPKAGLISLHIEWRDRAEAADWANDLVARINAEMRARAIARTNASVKFLERELADTRIVETREAISRLIGNEVNQRMYANVTEEYAFRVVDRALEPDLKDKVRPKRAFMGLLGTVLGFLCGVLLVLGIETFRRPVAART